MSVVVHGTVEPGFEAVAEAFRANFEVRGELGASVAAMIGDRVVVDLWAGTADVASDTPWERDTKATVFSTTKGLVAVAFLMLEDRGLLDVDKPVAWYWPEFGRAGKEDITVRCWLNHRSGISGIDAPLVLEDFQGDHRKVEAAISVQRPLWTPDSRQGYGATAWGMVAQALFRRVAGETLGTYLRREVFGPLEVDVHLGLPSHLHDQVATTYPMSRADLLQHVLPEVAYHRTNEGRLFRAILADRSSPSARAFLNPKLGKPGLKRVNERSVRELELPWMNAIGTARGLARIYGVLASGGTSGKVRLVRKAALQRVATKQSWSPEDAVLRKPLGYSQGFTKDEPHIVSPHEAAFGHTGAGGSVAFADPTHRLGMAYVMNRMDWRIRSPRQIALCQAMYRALENAA